MNGQTEMLIGQISGRFVIRENFDEKGAFSTNKLLKLVKQWRKMDILKLM
ncbi:MAG: hypothetical protein R2783_02675 [Gelidibacter sp.]